MNETYEVIGKDCKTGVGRDNKPYIIESLTINFNGKVARVRSPRDMSVNIGDQVKLGIGTRRGWGMAEVCAVVTDVVAKKQE